MMRPAASERRGPPSGQQREGEAVGKGTTVAPTRAQVSFKHCVHLLHCFFFVVVVIGENGELPRVYLVIGTSYLSPFKKSLTRRQSVWQALQVC